jgi:hypothetical protein
LIKVEEGLLDGEVLYHKLEEKTDEDKIAIRKQRAKKRYVNIFKLAFKRLNNASVSGSTFRV